MSDDAVDEVFACLGRMSDAVGNVFNSLRTKPIIGGRFGSGRFVLASWPFIENGLNATMYFVVVESGRVVIAAGRSRVDVLADARNVLQKVDPVRFEVFVGRMKAKRDAEDAEAIERQRAEAEEMAKARRTSTVRSIPRRRKQIYEASKGCCHYCGTALQLDGKWHIEHKMPKALMGSNERSNLVASCVPCNTKKRDSTDVEFKARLRSEKGAAA